MFLFKKNDNIGKYVVVFPHKEGCYAQTYRVKDENGKVKFLFLIFFSLHVALPISALFGFDWSAAFPDSVFPAASFSPELLQDV